MQPANPSSGALALFFKFTYAPNKAISPFLRASLSASVGCSFLALDTISRLASIARGL